MTTDVADLGEGVLPGVEPLPVKGGAWPAARVAYYTLFVLILSTTFAQLDINIVPYLMAKIRQDLHITDVQLSLLVGASFGLFYTVIGVPIAWFLDRYSRRWLLAAAITIWSLGTALCGVAQNYAGLFGARFLVGAGEAVNGPAAYAITADLFPRERMPRAVAILQIGSVLGPGLALLISAYLLHRFLDMAPIASPIGLIHGWQLIFILVGLPGILVAVLMAATMQDPPRHIIANQVAGGVGAQPRNLGEGIVSWFTDFGAAFAYLGRHWRVYGPMFGSLLVGSFGQGGIQWMPIFYQRTFGWGPAKLAALQSFSYLVVVPLGLVAAVVLAEHYVRGKREDAALRTMIVARLIGLPSIFAVLMPNPWIAWSVSLLLAFTIGFGGSSQSAALQTITPAELRGKITALFLFIYSVLGVGLSPVVTAMVEKLFHDQIRWGIFVPGIIFMPLSIIVAALGLRPYAREVQRIRALESAA